jgi:hypothetical protein
MVNSNSPGATATAHSEIVPVSHPNLMVMTTINDPKINVNSLGKPKDIPSLKRSNQPTGTLT